MARYKLKTYTYFSRMAMWTMSIGLLFHNQHIIVSGEEVMVEDCPVEINMEKSVQSSSEQVNVIVKSRADYDIHYYWVDFSGKEVLQSVVGAFERKNLWSFPGHVFRFRAIRDKRLHREVQIPDGGKHFSVDIQPCGDSTLDMALWDPGREIEFRGLMAKHPEVCEGEDSSKWSCIYRVSHEEEAARDPTQHGYAPGEEGHRKVGDTDDKHYTSHIPSIIRVTEGPGILLMNQTDHLKRTLFEWFELEKRNLVDHGVVSGGYTNTHVINIQKLSLDLYPHIHSTVVNEMRQVLQWWTNQRLKHTSSFGLREYKRGSMLINHVDRMDTHIASAVIQVEQRDIDEGGGWPLEVLLPAGCTNSEGECHRTEIYMQPGEMALYEGAKIMHGRPMRLRGEAFGNIFSHFAPIDWFGPNTEPRKKRRRKSPSRPSHDEL